MNSVRGENEICAVFPEPNGEEYQDIFGERQNENFHGGPVIKNLPAAAGDMGSIPGPGTKTLMCRLGQTHGPQLLSLHLEPQAANSEARALRTRALQQEGAPQ